jgi:DNA-binding transcriptional ArsR family regulator
MVIQLSESDFLEDVFGSRGRIRVLRALVEEGEMNISLLARRTGMNHTSVDRHCEKLRELGLIREKRYDRIRVLEVGFQEFEVRLKRGYGLDMIVDKVNLR